MDHLISPLEIEFFAEDQLVSIKPTFKLAQLYFIRDQYGV